MGLIKKLDRETLLKRSLKAAQLFDEYGVDYSSLKERFGVSSNQLQAMLQLGRSLRKMKSDDSSDKAEGRQP